NATQDEIVNVIEGAGIVLKTASTETGNQLLLALQTLSTPTVHYYTSSGTWTKPSNLVALKVTVIGSGGGGSGSETADGGFGGNGGAGGGATIKHYIASELDATEAYSIGAGGSGGAAQVTGSNGGSSTFKALTATGGGGGLYGAELTVSATPGAGSGGDLNLRGSTGGFGLSSVASDVAHDSQGGYGGGPALLGGSTTSVPQDVAGANGTHCGMGGGGAASDQTPDPLAGGDGADGLIIVEEIY
ncbi:unnamed protein product, partial [marine sediment metagenome]